MKFPRTQGFINIGRRVNRASGRPSIPVDVPSDHGARVIGERLNRNDHSQTAYGYGTERTHHVPSYQTADTVTHVPRVRRMLPTVTRVRAPPRPRAGYSQSVNLCMRIRAYAQLYSCSVDWAMIDHG